MGEFWIKVAKYVNMEDDLPDPVYKKVEQEPNPGMKNHDKKESCFPDLVSSDSQQELEHVIRIMRSSTLGHLEFEKK